VLQTSLPQTFWKQETVPTTLWNYVFEICCG
jgi:hypothetical protein